MRKRRRRRPKKKFPRILSIPERDALIKEHIPAAKKVAKGFANKYNLDYTEFESLVMQKIIEVADRYNPIRGPFKPYLLNSLRGYCFNFMRDSSRAVKLPRNFTDILLRSYKYKKTIGDWSAPNSEVAAAIEVTEEELEEVLDAMAIRYVEVKDCHIMTDEEDLEMHQLKSRMADLPVKAYMMLDWYFMEGKTYKEIAFHHRTTVQEVQRVIANSVSYLRGY